MVSRLLLLCVVIPFIYALTGEQLLPLNNLKADFQKFKLDYGKSYSSAAEDQLRFKIFSQNIVRAIKLQAEQGEEGASFGVTKFMDLTEDEFKAYKGFKPLGRNMRAPMEISEMSSPAVASPCSSSVCDWRTAGAVTPVKNQGQCGSCWAFSATEGLESGWFLGGHKLVALAPQQLVSCDKVDQGCNGGDLPTAYKYIEKAGGLESESSYPYTSGGGGNSACKFNSKSIVASMKNWTYAIPPCYDTCKAQNEGNLQKAVAAYGPASICVNANPWQFYTGGVMKASCPGGYSQLDHCVQLVGYHSSGSNNYWIVKNSWAADWGEQGYIYIQIGKNLCGVADEATFVKA